MDAEYRGRIGRIQRCQPISGDQRNLYKNLGQCAPSPHDSAGTRRGPKAGAGRNVRAAADRPARNSRQASG